MRLSACASPSHLTGFSQQQPVQSLQLKLCGQCDIPMCREHQMPFLLNTTLTLLVLKSLTGGNKYSFWGNLALAPLLCQVGLTYLQSPERANMGLICVIRSNSTGDYNVSTKFTTEKSILTTSHRLRFLNAAPPRYTHFSTAVTSRSPKQAENTF